MSKGLPSITQCDHWLSGKAFLGVSELVFLWRSISLRLTRGICYNPSRSFQLKPAFTGWRKLFQLKIMAGLGYEPPTTILREPFSHDTLVQIT